MPDIIHIDINKETLIQNRQNEETTSLSYSQIFHTKSKANIDKNNKIFNVSNVNSIKGPQNNIYRDNETDKRIGMATQEFWKVDHEIKITYSNTY